MSLVRVPKSCTLDKGLCILSCIHPLRQDYEHSSSKFSSVIFNGVSVGVGVVMLGCCDSLVDIVHMHVRVRRPIGRNMFHADVLHLRTPARLPHVSPKACDQNSADGQKGQKEAWKARPGVSLIDKPLELTIDDTAYPAIL